MKKHLTIIGGGFSSWIAASVFADSGYSIDIFEGKNESFGSQQITPNGWEALTKLIELKNIQKCFEPFYNIYIKKFNSKNNLELLYLNDLVEKNYNYGSIERKSIIRFFKKFIHDYWNFFYCEFINFWSIHLNWRKTTNRIINIINY